MNSNPAFLLPRQQFDNHLEMLWFAAHFISFTKQFNNRIKNQQLDQDMIVMRYREQSNQTLSKPIIKQLSIDRPIKNDENNNKMVCLDQNNNDKASSIVNGKSDEKTKIINQSNQFDQSISKDNCSDSTTKTNQSTNQQESIRSKPIIENSGTNKASLKKQPLCMQTYKHMFRAYRRPGDNKDELMINQDTNHNHIVIACRNQFFALSLNVDQDPNEANSTDKLDDDEKGDAFIEYLFSKLLTIWEFCLRLDTVQENSKYKKQEPIGFYTTEHRRTWWQIRQNLIKSLYLFFVLSIF